MMTDEAREARREYLRKYRKENADRIRESKRAWERENREKCNGYVRKWRRSHPEIVAEINARYWRRRAERMQKEQEEKTDE